MSKIIAVYSHSGGTGKSTIAAELGYLLASEGRAVCLVDTDTQSPSLHVQFGLEASAATRGLGDYLVGRCDIEQAVIDLSPVLDGGGGQLTLVPGRSNARLITEIASNGFDSGLLDEGIRRLDERLRPEVIVLDTHAGITPATTVALALADAMVIVVRADEKEYQGARVTAELTRRLSCPQTLVLVNMVADGTDTSMIEEVVTAAYDCEVTAVLPYSPDAAALGGSRVLSREQPGHPTSRQMREVAARVVAAPPGTTS